MWLNVESMPLQALVDRVANSKMWARIAWRIEDEGTSKARFVYDTVLRTNSAIIVKEISFEDVCKIFEWKSFTIDPSRQMVVVEHLPEHLEDLSH